jgi:serine/threonine protein kinase
VTLAERRADYHELSTALAYLDDRQLRAIVRHTQPAGRTAWGGGEVISLHNRRIYVKRLLLTERERAHMFSTRNHYRLPMYYQYGVGSAGFGAFRELAAYVKTTNAVLAGQVAGFPLLYHFRVMPRLGRPVRRDPAELRAYVARWNDSKAIEQYVRDRDSATHEIWLCSEHIPYQLYDWLRENQAAVDSVVRQLFTTVDFLRARGIVHFDAHLHNLLTDGSQTYISDFGLLLDPEFDLSATERAFLARHENFDYGEIVSCLEWLKNDATHPMLSRTIDRYGDVIAYMNGFFDTMSKNPRKNTRYDDATLAGLLAAAA